MHSRPFHVFCLTPHSFPLPLPLSLVLSVSLSRLFLSLSHTVVSDVHGSDPRFTSCVLFLFSFPLVPLPSPQCLSLTHVSLFRFFRDRAPFLPLSLSVSPTRRRFVGTISQQKSGSLTQTQIFCILSKYSIYLLCLCVCVSTYTYTHMYIHMYVCLKFGL